MKKKIQALELGCLGLSAVPTLANYKTLRCFYFDVSISSFRK